MKNEISLAANLIKIIEDSRNSAIKKVNEELIKMYWRVGEYLSKESEKATFGDAYIEAVVEEIQNTFPGIKGFNRMGLYRMKRFYETYVGDEFVTTVLTQIGWSQHLAILSKTKTMDERHFYIKLCIKESYSARELDRQKKKEYENPSVGVILCASKDDEIVEYAMSRTLSPLMVAEYKLQLPDKQVLQRKLQELIALAGQVE